MEIKIACAQVEVRPGRPEINLRRALETIEEAKRASIDILIFPEQLIPGYLLGDLWEQRAFCVTAAITGRISLQPRRISASFSAILPLMKGL